MEMRAEESGADSGRGSPRFARSGSTQFDVTFCFWGWSLDPTEVTRHLGLEPSGAYAPNVPQESPDGSRSTPDHGYWVWRTSSHVSSDRLDDHVRHLVELLEPRAEGVRRARETSDLTQVDIWGASDGNVAWFSCAAELLARLAPFVDSVDFSLVTSRTRATTIDPEPVEAPPSVT